MAEIITIPDLENGKVDIDTLADIVNLQESTTETRLSGPVKTWFGLQGDLSAATGLTYKTKAEMDAAPGTVVGQAARVTEDAANSGLYIWDGSVWSKTVDPLAGGNLTQNIGAEFPLKNMVRGGVTSAPSTFGNTSIIEARVSGPGALINGKYFKIAYIQNGAVVGTAGMGIRLEEFDAATYASTGTAVVIHATTDAPAGYDRAAGGQQTFRIRPALRPGLLFTITLNVAGMPPYGTHIQMGSAAGSGYSLIIDPANYYINYEQGDKINMGSDFPLKPMVRGGVESPKSITANDVFLSIKVIGPAEQIEGKYFGVKYLQNGAAIGTEFLYGIRLEEYESATYESTGTAVIINPTAGAQAGYDRAEGGIQEFTVTPTERPDLRFVFKINVDALPDFGTQLQMGSSVVAAYSWIIDQSNYFPVSVSGGGASVWGSPTYIKYTHATRDVDTVSRTSAENMKRFTFKKNGYNSLPNPYGIAIAPFGNPASATFDQFNFNTSEWFGVMHLKAVNNGDGNESRWATGGNHGTNGTATGPNTARNVIHRVLVDGQELTGDFEGYSNSVQIQFSNDLMAYNTVTLGRYVLRQTYWVNIVANSCSVHALYTALEEIYVQRDRGVQVSPTGYTATALFPRGSNTSRIALTPSVDSGASSSFPDAWGVVLKGDKGQLGMWTDLDFGIATERATHVAPTMPLVTGSKGTSTKLYSGLIESTSNNSGTPDSTALHMMPGDSYEWRGGYMWDEQETVPNIDSILKMLVNQTVLSAVILPDGTSDEPTF